MTKGLTLAVTTLTLNSDDVIKAYEATGGQNTDSDTNGTRKTTSLNSAKFTESGKSLFLENFLIIFFLDNILNYVMPPLADLKTSYESAFQDYLDAQKKIEIIKFVLFILFCFFAFFFLWQPYLKNLKDKIFRTKGMLNMIPMDIISKNESLRGQFLGDNIMRAVK